MPSHDETADYLETGHSDALGEESRDRLDAIRILLAADAVWADPPPDLGAVIGEAIREERPTVGRRWLWIGAAILVSLVGGYGLFRANDPGVSPISVVAMTGTDLAPGANGSAGFIPTPNGWAIELDVSGLPPAAPGTYYQGWVTDGAEGVSVGSFHMRGDQPGPIGLWAGVDLHDYPTLKITVQKVGEGPVSSGLVVMSGTATTFSDTVDD